MDNSEKQLIESKELLTIAGRFTEDIAKAEPDPIRRADWIIYILKSLADFSSRISYEEMLKTVRDATINRLVNGDW